MNDSVPATIADAAAALRQGELTSVEQTVIRRRFNWQEQQESPLTLEEVGRIIGVTKERVRQIQNKALAKIKQVMEDGVLRTTPNSGEDDAAPATPAAVPTPPAAIDAE